MVTVESSTSMPTASASPPSVMVVEVSPRKYSTMSEVRIASGIEIMTTTVDRHDPRNSRIISAVSAAAIAPSRDPAPRTLPSTPYWVPELVGLARGVDRLALVDERRVARDHEQLA